MNGNENRYPKSRGQWNSNRDYFLAFFFAGDDSVFFFVDRLLFVLDDFAVRFAVMSLPYIDAGFMRSGKDAYLLSGSCAASKPIPVSNISATSLVVVSCVVFFHRGFTPPCSRTDAQPPIPHLRPSRRSRGSGGEAASRGPGGCRPPWPATGRAPQANSRRFAPRTD